MMERALHLTDYDYERLELLLDNMNRVPQNRREDLSRLEDDLATCRIVASEEMPANIVTIHSKVRYLDLDTNKERVVTLVFPSNADISKGRISIVVPLGAAIIGRAAGDTVSMKIFNGTMNIRIEAVLYQPEAAGDYHL